MHLAGTVLLQRLADHLGHGDGDAAGGDHQQDVEDIEGGAEVGVAAGAENIDQRHFVHGADDLDDQDACRQYGRAAEEGVRFLFCHDCLLVGNGLELSHMGVICYLCAQKTGYALTSGADSPAPAQ